MIDSRAHRFASAAGLLVLTCTAPPVGAQPFAEAQRSLAMYSTGDLAPGRLADSALKGCYV